MTECTQLLCKAVLGDVHIGEFGATNAVYIQDALAYIRRRLIRRYQKGAEELEWGEMEDEVQLILQQFVSASDIKAMKSEQDRESELARKVVAKWKKHQWRRR